MAFKLGLSLAILLLWTLPAPQNPAQGLILIYDPLAEPPAKSDGLSVAEKALVGSEVLPATRQYWKGRGVECGPNDRSGFNLFPSVVHGSFTRAGVSQEGVLYRYCATRRKVAKNGIVVLEAGRVVAHIVYEGGWGNGLLALPDIDGSGQSPMLIVGGGTTRGETVEAVAILKLSGEGVTNFGYAWTYDAVCGAALREGQKGQKEAYRLFARRGATPVFYLQAFVGGCKEPPKWVPSGNPEQITLVHAGQPGVYVRLK